MTPQINPTNLTTTLTNQGHTILDSNYQTRYGIIPLITLTNDQILHFVYTECAGRHGGYDQDARRAAVEWLLDPQNRTSHQLVHFDLASMRDNQLTITPNAL